MARIILFSLRNVLSFLLVMVLFSSGVYASEKIVKIAVSQNPPIVYQDDDGTFKGLGIGVLNYIAEKEGWQLQYFSRSWVKCIEMLESGETDLQAGIAFTEQRAKKYDYNNETLLSNWGQIYIKPDSKLVSILDLEGKKISLVKKSVHSLALKKLVKGLGVNCTFVEVDNYHDVYKHLLAGKTDAAMTNRTFGLTNAVKYGLKRTAIVFNPIEIRYAVLKGTDTYLLNAIDKHLKVLKGNPGSIYNQLLANLLGEIPAKKMPKWVKPALYFASILILIISVVALIQRFLVQQKEKEITFRKQAENTLKSLVEGTASTGGRDFFPDLVRNLAEAVGVQYALVAEFQSDSLNQANTIAVWTGKSIADNFTYDLVGTPCANVKQKGLCIYPKNICQLFPKDTILVDMSAESYIGVTLLDNYGNPLGLLALIDTSPFGDTTQAEYLMNIFSTRAAMELERLRAEKEREKLIKDLQTTLDEIKTLRGILPICSYCKKIRDDQGAWDRVEAYICAHSEVEFSHGICPECYQKYENGDFD